MLKRERQKKLLGLIRAKRIGTQEALRSHLERAGAIAGAQNAQSATNSATGFIFILRNWTGSINILSDAIASAVDKAQAPAGRLAQAVHAVTRENGPASTS